MAHDCRMCMSINREYTQTSQCEYRWSSVLRAALWRIVSAAVLQTNGVVTYDASCLPRSTQPLMNVAVIVGYS